jgi:ABC-type sugar transport system ATPase subunit
MLELFGIEKRFGGVAALRGVDFDLAAGEVHAIIGENGAGKSTLIKILSGLHAPDSGSIRFDGAPVRLCSASDAQRLGIQTVHQELELAEGLTVAENLFMGRLPRGRFGLIERRAAEQEARRGLARLGALIDPASRIADLSIGDRQVVEITRAILRRARVVVMDEPTATLPASEVGRLFEVISRLTAAGTGVIYVSHRLEEVLAIADRITVLRDGQVTARINRGEADRVELIRHILGRDLVEFTHGPPADPDGAAVMRCENLRCPPSLNGLSFAARHGEVLGFFGLLGAGQNMVGDALFGLRPAKADFFHAGSASGLPRDPRAALARGFGYVPADRKGAGLALGLSISDNLCMPNLAAISRGGMIDRTKEQCVARALIDEYRIRCASPDQQVGDLSGGNQQKVSVAKWANRGLSTLFFDEPTRGVDVGARVEIYRFIRDFAAGGRTVLVASSDADEIAGLCDRAIVLRAGVAALELSGAELSEAKLLELAL